MEILRGNAKLNERLASVLKRNDFPSYVIFGDSITAQNGFINTDVDSVQYWNWGYFYWTQLMANGHITCLQNAGIGGNETYQMLVRIDNDVLKYKSDCVIVEGGINDVNTGTLADITISNLTKIYDLVRQNGSMLTITTVTPSVGVSTDTRLSNLNKINEFIRNYALKNKDVILCDWFQCVAGQDGRYFNAAHTYDGTHTQYKRDVKNG